MTILHDPIAPSSVSWLRREAVSLNLRGVLAALVVFALSTAAAVASHEGGLPITAALIYVLGVTLIGSFAGVRSGVAAALATSVVYNFFISEPALRFSLTSPEEYVPLIVFNLAAIVSGVLAGRLQDRAQEAEASQRQLRQLFQISSRLQAAVHVDELPAAVAGAAGDGGDDIEIYVSRPPTLQALGSTSSLGIAERLVRSGSSEIAVDGDVAHVLGGRNEPSGVLVLHDGDQARERLDGSAIANLLSIALERCLLLERLAEAEAVRRSERFKTSLIASVSHDMRTPLAAISAAASGLSRYGDDLGPAAKRDLLRTIETQCDRLNRYTTNLLNLGRIQSGLDATAFAEVDAVEVLGGAIVRAREFGSAYTIDKDIKPGFALVRGDAVMLEQLFYNVLENAIRYSSDGSPVRVRAEAAGDRLIVSISDEGPGIAPQDQDRIFDRFYRGGGAVPREGSGLGLAISKGFAEAFGGTIEVESPLTSAGGTRMRIVLPLWKNSVRSEP